MTLEKLQQAKNIENKIRGNDQNLVRLNRMNPSENYTFRTSNERILLPMHLVPSFKAILQRELEEDNKRLLKELETI